MKTIQFMSKTIDDFRNFYREDKEKRRFDLAQAVEDTLNLQRAQLEAREIELVERLEPVEIEGFRNDLMQVVLNLVSNARDAIMARKEKEPNLEGRIEVSVYEEDGEAVVKVRDNGGGIPQEILERIFEPYFTTKEEGQGTGLGLHMARRIVEEKMGGRLTAANEGDGAVFTIRIRKENAGPTE
jgi:signal transduction histidine kinase